MCNSKYKVVFKSIDANDLKGLTQVQQQINTWITTGLLAKYEMHTTVNSIVFNICLLKK